MSVVSASIRRLDSVQRHRLFRIFASLLVVAAAAGFFGTIIGIRVSWDHDAAIITEAMTSDEADRYGLLLRTEGAAVIEGTTYSGPQAVMETMIDEDGQPLDVQRIVFVLLRDAIPGWAPSWLLLETELSWLLMTITIIIGVAVIWSGLVLRVAGLLAAGGVCSLVAWALGWDRWIAVPVVITLLLSTYFIVIRCLQTALAGRQGWMAVAHTLLCEVTRTRLALGFVVVLLMALPLLPLTLDEAAPIDQLVQAYLARSLDLAFAMAAILVLMIGCSSISFDIRDRHIWHLVTKPLARVQYLFGKWVGVVLLGSTLMLIAGAWSYGYVRYLDSTNIPRTEAQFEAKEALKDDVLVAATSRYPVYEELSFEDIRGRVDEIILEDPSYRDYVDGEVPVGVRRLLHRRVHDEFDQARRRVASNLDRSRPPWLVIHFEGLSEAKKIGRPLRLGFRLLGGTSDEHDRRLVGFSLGEDRGEGVIGAFIPTVPQHVDVPAGAISDDGTLDVSIVNLTHMSPPSGNDWLGPVNLEAIAMSPGDMEPFELFWVADELEIAYQDGTFGNNFLRGLVMLILKLAILGAIACGAASLLSFPVAALMVFTVYAAASIAPWLATTLPAYGSGPEAGEGVGAVIQQSVQWIIRTVAGGMVYLFRAFGELQPVGKLVVGRQITWSNLCNALLMLVTWGGGGLLAGWAILTRRQLAIYSGEQ